MSNKQPDNNIIFSQIHCLISKNKNKMAIKYLNLQVGNIVYKNFHDFPPLKSYLIKYKEKRPPNRCRFSNLLCRSNFSSY